MWKSSNLAPGYEVSNFGKIRMPSRHVVNRGRRYFRKAKLLKLYESSDSYQFVVVFPFGQKTKSGTAVSKKHFVHRMVMDAFVGSCPEGMTVDHIDRNRQNNKLENLRYATKSEQDANRDLSGISGENSRFSKLDWDKVRKIRQLHTEGKAITTMAKRFNVGGDTIRRVVNNKTWKEDQ